MKPPVVIILSETSVAIARKIQLALPNTMIYGLAERTQAIDVSYTKFGDTVRERFNNGTPIIGICAAGILIRSLAPLLSDKRAEPPVIAVAEDGSAVVPLLGGLTGANELATTDRSRPEHQCCDYRNWTTALQCGLGSATSRLSAHQSRACQSIHI